WRPPLRTRRRVLRGPDMVAGLLEGNGEQLIESCRDRAIDRHGQHLARTNGTQQRRCPCEGQPRCYCVVDQNDIGLMKRTAKGSVNEIFLLDDLPAHLSHAPSSAPTLLA